MTAKLLHAVFWALALALVLTSCGGGGGSTSSGTSPGSGAVAAAAANVQPIVVNAGLGGNVNLAYVSITLCAPGSSGGCQTIDDIVVDTGSSGLRVLASALSPSLALTQQIDAKGNPIVECAHFIDGYTWGPVKRADLKIAGEQALGLAMQVIGDPSFAAVPARCAASGPSKSSASSLRANGILGLSVFRQDCGSACTVANNRGIYYSCSGDSCLQTPVALVDQVRNPVSLFAANNNGVVIQLPSVPEAGAASTIGALVFGIGTQANNALGSAKVIRVDANSGNFTTVYNGSSLSASFIDGGSNAYFLPDTLPRCGATTSAPGFYCPVATLSKSAAIQGTNGAIANIDFRIANADALLSANPAFAAFPNLGAPLAGSSFDWGLPFFYGRNVYTAIEGANTPGGVGPYVAF